MEADVSEDSKPNEATQETAVSRREFGAVSLAAGLAVVAGAGAAEAAERPLTETEVTVKTPDGNCDAAFIHPTTGSFPGVLIWPDAFGLRPVMRQIARRIASEGYSVLVPNPFYRTAKAPVFDNPSGFNFDNPEDRAKLPPLTGPLQAAGAAEKDAMSRVAPQFTRGAALSWHIAESTRSVESALVLAHDHRSQRRHALVALGCQMN